MEKFNVGDKVQYIDDVEIGTVIELPGMKVYDDMEFGDAALGMCVSLPSNDRMWTYRSRYNLVESAKKWKPTESKKHWFIVLDKVGLRVDDDDYDALFDKGYKIGNCFRTKKEAQVKLKEIKQVLKK